MPATKSLFAVSLNAKSQLCNISSKRPGSSTGSTSRTDPSAIGTVTGGRFAPRGCQ